MPRLAHRKSKLRRSPRLESLESRRLLACDIEFTGSRIKIHGSDHADVVTVTAKDSVFGPSGPGHSVEISLQCGPPGPFGMPPLSGTYTELWFYGEGANDVLTNSTALPVWADGGTGDDQLQGGTGDDLLLGGSDDDQLSGGPGNDLLYGNSGNDELFGELGSDWLYGNQDDDILHGGDDMDALWGGSGNDSLYGDGGSDDLFGEEGNDGLYGGLLLDSLFGGAGADRFLIDTGASDVLHDVNLEDDAKIHFADGEGWADCDEIYAGGMWTPQEIEQVDRALRVVHRVAGGTHLLKKLKGSEVTFTRLGAFEGKGDSHPAWNNGGDLWFTNTAFNDLLDHYVYHEIGHTFYDKEFHKLSSWTQWSIPNYLPPGFLRSTGPNNFIYHRSATFAEEHGKFSPKEDFAISFAALFVDAAGEVYLPGDDSALGASAIPEKIKWLYENVVNPT